jgi:hypothetical protein
MTIPNRRQLLLVLLLWTSSDTSKNNSIILVDGSSASSSHDSAWYPFSNPNADDPMYYRASVNVLNGIANGEFSNLYIKYHGCV